MGENTQRRESLNVAIGELAALFEYGELKIATCPADFFREVTAHIVAVRQENARRKQLVEEYVSDFGICEDAPDGENYCAFPTCSYCALAREADRV